MPVRSTSPRVTVHLAIPLPRTPHGLADPGRPEEVAEALRACLGPWASCALPPEPISWGWETHVYRLRFRPSPGLPRDLAGPLVLRVYASPEGAPRARREFAALRHLSRLGFPVPRPACLVCEGSPFGGPFLLMECVPGPTLFHTLFGRPRNLWTAPARMAELQTRLHDLPAGRLGPALRRPDGLAALIQSCRLDGLAPGLDWLADHRPDPVRSASVLHLDWHPLNLIRRPDGSLAALDWSEVALGDPHADVATTLLLLCCVPAEGCGWWQGLTVPVFRPYVARRYLWAYCRRRPLDRRRLSYFLAWAALRRLAHYGRWLRAGPASDGSKPTVLEHLRDGHLDALARCFLRCTGVEVRL